MTQNEILITLPNDIDQVAKLWRKLDEYRARLIDPDFLPHKLDTICKMAVLEGLLNEGQVRYDAMRDRLQEEYGSECLGNFATAFRVMQDYVATGGERVCGGTSLK